MLSGELLFRGEAELGKCNLPRHHVGLSLSVSGLASALDAGFAFIGVSHFDFVLDAETLAICRGEVNVDRLEAISQGDDVHTMDADFDCMTGGLLFSDGDDSEGL